jgi:FixJ family two-component response regulator
MAIELIGRPVRPRPGPSRRLGVATGVEESEASARGLISLVDDDESVRESLPDLLRSFGFEVESCASAEEFLASKSLERTACLILDVAMPGMSGPELQEELARQKRNIPIVFITAQSIERVCPELMKRGAAACLLKPFSETAIVEAVSAALGTG